MVVECACSLFLKANLRRYGGLNLPKPNMLTKKFTCLLIVRKSDYIIKYIFYIS